MSDDPGKLTFFDEARELLGEIEESLLELEVSPEDCDQVARLFRAMHTLKGSGSMFGFDEIARFTHEVETVYDMVRAGTVPLKLELLGLTFEAKDHIERLLTATDTTPLKSRSDLLMARFRRFSGLGTQETSADAQPAASRQQASAGPRQTFWVRYRPSATSFHSGINPLGLLEELSSLGLSWIKFRDDEIPPLESLEAEHAYGFWDVLLVTDKGEDALRDVFIFVDDDGGVSIHKISDLSMRDADSQDLLALAESRSHLPSGQVAGELADLMASRTAFRGTGVSAPSDRRDSQAQDKAVAAPHSSSIRVDSTRLDSLVNLVGELVIVQSRLTQAARNGNLQAVRGIAEELQRLTSEMRDHTLGIRMVPIGSLHSTLRRLVRDLASSLNKDIRFVTHGAETELDKNVIDRLKDPLVHILRNSADHGIEFPQERLRAGKPEKGTVTLTAGHDSGSVLITIQDDGQGIDPQRIRQKAVENGLIEPEAELSQEQIYDLLFQPGFSTAKTVSNISGRGVGMDVVRKNIEALRGAISIESTPGRGTSLNIRLPLTLAIIDGLMFRVGRELFIIPLPLVLACQERPGVWPQKKVDVVEMRGDLIPCLSLRKLLNIPGKPPAYERIIIAGVEGALVGLAVDSVVGQQQAVIKSLSRLYHNVRWVSGTTINGDGGVSLILDVPQLVRFAQEQSEVSKLALPAETGAQT
ncbi:chemotaxis protein CheA [Fundidesulfovibrio butyratiphilus]